MTRRGASRSVFALALAAATSFEAAALRPASSVSLFGGEKSVALGGARELQVSPMGFGTWAWGNKLLWGYDEGQDASLFEAFDVGTAGGVDWFDSADSYGTGKIEGNAERLFGAFSARASSRRGRDAKLFTKFAPYPWRVGKDSIVAACDGALARSGKAQLEVAQLHWPPTLGWQQDAYFDGLAECVNTGRAKAIGLSNFGPQTLAAASAAMERRGAKLSSNQVQFSLLSRSPGEQVAVANELGVSLIGYSPLALGLLSGKYSVDNLPRSALRRQLFREALPKIEPLVATMRQIAASRNKSVPQVAVNYVLCKGALPLVGVRDAAQARENLGALGWRMAADEVAELEAVARRCNSDVVQNVFQTR